MSEPQVVEQPVLMVLAAVYSDYTVVRFVNACLKTHRPSRSK